MTIYTTTAHAIAAGHHLSHVDDGAMRTAALRSGLLWTVSVAVLAEAMIPPFVARMLSKYPYVLNRPK